MADRQDEARKRTDNPFGFRRPPSAAAASNAFESQEDDWPISASFDEPVRHPTTVTTQAKTTTTTRSISLAPRRQFVPKPAAPVPINVVPDLSQPASSVPAKERWSICAGCTRNHTKIDTKLFWLWDDCGHWICSKCFADHIPIEYMNCRYPPDVRCEVCKKISKVCWVKSPTSDDQIHINTMEHPCPTELKEDDLEKGSPSLKEKIWGNRLANGGTDANAMSPLERAKSSQKRSFLDWEISPGNAKVPAPADSRRIKIQGVAPAQYHETDGGDAADGSAMLVEIADVNDAKANAYANGVPSIVLELCTTVDEVDAAVANFIAQNQMQEVEDQKKDLEKWGDDLELQLHPTFEEQRAPPPRPRNTLPVKTYTSPFSE